MNNKGQTLVIFVIILPIILILITLVVDLGLLHIEKRKIQNNVLSASEYYLENINDIDIENKVKNLLNKNIKKIDSISIEEKDNFIEIKVTKKNNSLYNIISNKELIVIYKIDKVNKRIIKG